MSMRLRGQSGFTLIEVLVVVALTVLLFALLFAPMIAAFNLNKQARARIDAQDAARLNLERVSREISDAMFVSDNSTPIQIPPAIAGNPAVELANAKLDIVLPRMMMHCNAPDHPAGKPRDYERDSDAADWPGEEAWPSCPESASENPATQDVTARPMVPLTPSHRIVRYFVGLLHPDLPYSNNWEDKTNAPSVTNNTYVLYRAEFSAYGDPKDKTNNLLPTIDDAGTYDLNYPNFFYNPDYSAKWKKISHIVGPSTNVNLVIYGKNAAGQYDGTATSTIRFTPTSIENDALSPTYLSDAEAEVPTAIPTVFRAQQGLWTPYYMVQVGRNGFSSTYFTRLVGNEMWLWLQDSSGQVQIFDIDTPFLPDGSPNWGGGATAANRMMLTVDKKMGEVKFVFDGQPETAKTNDLLKADPPGYYQINKAQYGDNARIAPGSEEIFGPDQTPMGQPRQVRYARVPLALGTPGLNQYKIDYDTGEVWFANGVESLPPNAEVTINYKFHTNAPTDIIRADYSTKNLLTITFGIRVVDSLAGKMYATELTNKVHVRNTAR